MLSVQAALHGQRKPLLGAGFELEIHARGVTNRPQQPHGLIRKAVDRERAHFPFFEIGEPVGGIEQQTARRSVQREGDRVDARNRAGADPP